MKNKNYEIGAPAGGGGWSFVYILTKSQAKIIFEDEI